MRNSNIASIALKTISFLLVFFAFQQSDGADDVIVPANTGLAYIKDVGGDLLPLNVAYTTDGNGHLKLFSGADPTDDDLLIPANSGKMFLRGADSNLYPAMVLYTTDGNGNVQPISTSGGGGSGTVTSVGLTLPGIFTVTGSPVTTSGTLVGDLATQVQKTFFAGPTSGSDATPTFRVIAAADIPTLNQNTTGSAGSFTSSLVGDVTGTQGSTVVGAINGVSLAGLSTGILKNTTATGIPSIAISTDFPTLNQNTTGTAANITATTNTSLTSLANLVTVGTIGTGVWAGTAVAVNHGGTGQTTYTDGQLLIGNSSGNTLSKSSLTAGSNISITPGNGSISIAATIPSISLTTGVSGVLPVANGGTNASAFTLGSIVFAGASGTYTQNNADLFWDNTNFRLGIGTTSPQGAIDATNAGASIFTRTSSSGSGTLSAAQYGLKGNASTVGTGPAMIFFADNSAGAKSFTGRMTTAWDNGASGSEASSVTIDVRANSADTNATTEVMRFTSSSRVGILTTTPGSSLSVNGSYSGAVNAITTSTTLDVTMQMITADATSGAITVTLPACVTGIIGRKYNVVKIDSSINAVTITRASSDLINGATTLALSTQYAKSGSVVCAAAGIWYVL